MRSRTIREGSVGLLILLALGIFGGLILWLRGLSLGNRSYRAVVEFPNVVGMVEGSAVRYRGVVVGKVRKIRPGPQFAEVEMQISPATVQIPRDSAIQTNQAGLIGETVIDIVPRQEFTGTVATNPFAADCPGSEIICDGDRLPGEVGVTFDALISSTIRLSNQFSDPELIENLKDLTLNSARAAAGVTTLTGEVTELAKSVQIELRTLAGSANQTTTSVGSAATQLGLTAAQVNTLLETNRYAISSTLSNLDQASSQVRLLTTRLTPLVDDSQFVQNLNALSDNAARASLTLRSLTDAIGTPENVLVLQQTLDSARATFQNAEKITADLDELTGDPAFRSTIRDLLRSLENLLSSTQQLEQQIALEQLLTPAAIALQNKPAAASPSASPVASPTPPAPIVAPPVIADRPTPEPRPALRPRTRLGRSVSSANPPSADKLRTINTNAVD
ncbi:MAG: MlaD family protein [Cyanobacteria bacterium J069]|nr:MAG: MCE family protein [Cyanobacteria bacterium J069]